MLVYNRFLQQVLKIARVGIVRDEERSINRQCILSTEDKPSGNGHLISILLSRLWSRSAYP